MKKSSLKRILHFSKDKKKWVWISIFSSLFMVVFNLFKIWFIMELINDIGQPDLIARLISNSIWIVLFCLFSMAAAYLSRYASGQYGYSVEKNTKSRLVEHMSMLPFGYLKKKDTGDLLTGINNDISVITDFMVKNFSDFITQFLMCIAGFAFLMIINVKLAVSILLSIGITLTINSLIKTKMKAAFDQGLSQTSDAYSMIYNAFGGIDTIKAYNLEEKVQHKSEDLFHKVFLSQVKTEKYSAIMLPSFISMKHIPKILCFLLGGYMAIRGEITLGGLMAIIQTLDYLIQSAVNLPNMIANWYNAESASHRICDVLECVLEREDGQEFRFEEPVLNISHLSFAYEESNVINDISLSIQKGQKIAFVGKSGCGKSTMLDLICGFYNHYDGKITIGGHDLEEWNLRALRSHISYVSQNAFLFSGTIEENIRCGNTAATHEDVIRAAKAADAHAFIMGTDNGYDTDVGERGCHLSGGQRQRISIARAVLKNADILIMDEPTSALDVDTEKALQAAIDDYTAGHTVITVAHRFSTIKDADIIYVFEDGRIVEKGTNQELLEKKGTYVELYKKQQYLSTVSHS